MRLSTLNWYRINKVGDASMSSGFQNPITIKDAIDKIHSRQFLLPAIQRKFTWSSSQIEMLFDSILRGYPINSFMLWKISDCDIKSGYKFYEFITAYIESSLEKIIRILIQRVCLISRQLLTDNKD